ncbi:uncharacterized protein BX663DRAFT_97534 [Cokeromyces recurvatus]|uniref:uncharacterized protein n=1 Tax=Cokeromyces recurvatus TaxID=90255 RepID=UPI00221F9CDB|nr:uncharacterized protein BX663DRAFT_97534 [Cokeromyces recurvatus]KAI7901565.1 hypothetical protein BX663DRAFT_97534 [Cokeromyces recurvatus]
MKLFNSYICTLLIDFILDTITHLVFKNGSPTTFNKAKTKGKHIVNLLWVTHCQEKNKKVPEEEYKVTIAPQKLIGNKRRKSSMEPGRVKALFGHESSLSDNIASDNEEVRRRTIVTTDWVAKSLESNKRAISREREIRKRYIEELEKEEESAKKEDPLAKLDKPSLPPRLSLPICAETIANRHTTKKRKSNMNEIIPVEPPSKEAQEQIKARFSIGDKNTKNNITDTNDNSNNDSTITIPSSSSSSHSHNNNSSSNSKNPLATSNNSSLSNSKNNNNNNNNNNSIIPVELPQIPQINNNSIRRRKLKVYTQSPSSTDTVKQPLALKVSIDRTSNTSSKNVK